MIKKITAFLLIFLNFYLTSYSLEAGVKYNDMRAKIEAFKDVQKKIDKDLFKKYKKDKNKDENISLIEKNILNTKGRQLYPFYYKKTLIAYAIMYDEKDFWVFYYNILGNLIKVDIQENSNKFPTRTLSYTRFGNLAGVVFSVSEDEQFIYNKNAKLIAHWIGNDLYNKDNLNFKFLKIKRGLK